MDLSAVTVIYYNLYWSYSCIRVLPTQKYTSASYIRYTAVSITQIVALRKDTKLLLRKDTFVNEAVYAYFACKHIQTSS